MPKTHDGHNVQSVTQRRSRTALGQELRLLREGRGLSQSEVAELLGYSPKMVYRWEQGLSVPRRLIREQYNLLLTANHSGGKVARKNPDFTFIDLFAGIGGFRFAFEKAGGGCVFTSEWDKHSQITYRENFPHSRIHGDITKVPLEQIPEHDVLLAGFPCQPFSIAGVSKKNALGRAHGFACDTQGTLFFDIARILQFRRPQAFLLENVKNLKSHDRGNTYRVIEHTLANELGYRIFPTIIDARRVLPQHRERVFIVGFREDIRFDWQAVRLGNDQPTLQSILHPEDGSETPEQRFTDAKGRVLSRYTLTDHLWAYLQNYAEKHRQRGNGFGYGLVDGNSVARTLSARYHKDGSEILVQRRRGNPRRLTPRECARLMGFDRKWTGRHFRIPDRVSDTQLYRQFGNSVAVPVVAGIARAMARHIRAEAPYSPEDQLELAAIE